MTAPIVAGVGAWAKGATTPVTTPFPTSVLENDIAICFTAMRNPASSDSGCDITGFANFGFIQAGGSGLFLLGFWKRCDSTEGGTNATVNLIAGAAERVCRIITFRGCIESGSPLEGLATNTNASSVEDITAADVTTGGEDRYVINFCARRKPNDPVGASYPPAGWTNLANNNGSTAVESFVLGKSVAAAGTVPGAFIDFDDGFTEVWATQSFALIPPGQGLPLPLRKPAQNTLLRM
jgi:hypothetical protein